MTDLYQRELAVQNRVRLLTFAVHAAAMVSLALSFTEASAADWPHRANIIAAIVPSIWVLRSPRKVPVLVWAAWFVALMVVANRMPVVAPELGSTAVRGGLALLWIAMSLTVLIALPIVRLGTPEPPPPPEARVVVRDD